VKIEAGKWLHLVLRDVVEIMKEAATKLGFVAAMAREEVKENRVDLEA
jgi:hypothetical protein